MRCYNGQPDKELQAIIDDDRKVGEEIAAMGLSITYFPVEQAWMVFDSNHHPVTGFCNSKRGALNAAQGK
jgi:hypothetical protein